jgi:hypothetical protein
MLGGFVRSVGWAPVWILAIVVGGTLIATRLAIVVKSVKLAIRSLITPVFMPKMIVIIYPRMDFAFSAKRVLF